MLSSFRCIISTKEQSFKLTKTKVMEFYISSALIQVYFDYNSFFLVILFKETKENLTLRMESNEKIARLVEFFQILGIQTKEFNYSNFFTDISQLSSLVQKQQLKKAKTQSGGGVFASGIGKNDDETIIMREESEKFLVPKAISGVTIPPAFGRTQSVKQSFFKFTCFVREYDS